MKAHWIQLAVACSMLLQATAFPHTQETESLDDVRRPEYRGNLRTRESKSSVAETLAPTKATPIGESLRSVTKQLLQPTDMVATDVRTPPRVKTKTEVKGEAKIERVTLGEGVGEAMAVDVVTQAPGLSTWILLSNADQAKGKPATQATIQAVEKPVRKTNETTKAKPTQIVKTTYPKKQNSSDESTKSPIILQDSKFKNRTPVVVGKVPTTQTENITTTTMPSKKKPISVLPTQPTKFAEIVPTTSLVLETETVESVDDNSTTEQTTSTTKRTRRPGTKKKKKNKIRRRRPSKPDNDTAESKITQDTNLVSSNKVEGLPNRPLSTRIYNYLAREVMPSVGVGIVGLVLTAGLAGLFLYPFGGGIARRNYEKDAHPMHNNYYYSDYVPHRDTDVKPEKKIFGQAINTMSSYSPTYESKYNNKFRYDAHDYGHSNVNGYVGSSEYSTLPESVKNSGYATPLSENKYYSMDTMSPHYKLSEAQEDKYKDDGNYPSLTEYTSYTNAASVGTRGSFEDTDVKQNDTKEEDKSDKSQPQFSALVGSPQFIVGSPTNTDFVGSVSLTGSYGTEGALASEHGPRALRATRDVHDDFANEIDVSDDKILRKPAIPSPPTDISKVETTTMVRTTTAGETTTEAPTSPLGEQPQETTTDSLFGLFGEDNKDTSTSTDSLDAPGGFLGFLRRLAQLKLKIGISLLKSTSDVVQRYFDNVAKRMEDAVRNLDKRRRSLSSSRIKRSTITYNKMKKLILKKQKKTD